MTVGLPTGRACVCNTLPSINGDGCGSKVDLEIEVIHIAGEYSVFGSWINTSNQFYNIMKPVIFEVLRF